MGWLSYRCRGNGILGGRRGPFTQPDAISACGWALAARTACPLAARELCRIDLDPHVFCASQQFTVASVKCRPGITLSPAACHEHPAHETRFTGPGPADDVCGH